MSKRRKKGSVEGAEEAGVEVLSEADMKFAEGLKGLERAKTIKQRVTRKIEAFKRRGKITPGALKRVFLDILAALD